jgi:hypothetical protein
MDFYNLYPLIWRPTSFFYWLAFFFALSIGSRVFARWRYLPSQKKARDVWGRYPASWVHAIGAVLYAVIIGDPLTSAAFSSGYFIADMIVDRDVEYIFHHISPMISMEAGLRLCNPIHGAWAFAMIEFGNVFAHSAALLTLRSGPLFHKINVASFWISRPLSFIPGFQLWSVDMNPETRWSWIGLALLGSMLFSYAQNLRWMLKMIQKRPAKLNKTANGDTSDSDSDTAKTETEARVSPSKTATPETNGTAASKIKKSKKSE